MHIYQLPSGRWRVQVGHQGQRAAGTAATKPAARVLGAELLVQLGARRTADTVEVGELIDGHLARVEWSPTTLYNALRVAAEAPEVFRSRPVADVDGAVLAALYRQLGGLGWSAHKIRCLHNVISTAWSEAITWGWATVNPARFVKLPKLKPREVRPPDTDAVAQILAASSGVATLFLRLAATTGARRGELVGLQWDAVDTDAAQILIARSLVVTGGTEVVERDTKTSRKGHRVVPLDLPTIALLRRHRSEQLEQSMAAGQAAPVWVFSHDAGRAPWRPDYATRMFLKTCQRAGVSGVRLHDLRHYVATSMLQDGEAPIDVAAQLGHADTSTTLQVYAHYMPGRGRDSVDRRAARLDGLGAL